MNRDQLAKILRAASQITGDRKVLVLGSQSILGIGDANTLPRKATMSSEADLAFFDDEDRHKADQITAVLDEMTPFHDLHNVYAEGVHVSTAILPEGWINRIFTTDIDGSDPAEPYFLDPNDLVASKLSAGREKDHEFCASVLDAGLADPKTVADYAKELPQRYSKRVEGWISSYSVSKFNRRLTERVVGVRTDSGRLFVIKISYRKGTPYSITELDLDGGSPRWKQDTVLDGTNMRASYVLGLAERLTKDQRRVPRGIAAKYGKSNGRCILCNRPLTDESSINAGYGPKCAAKFCD